MESSLGAPLALMRPPSRARASAATGTRMIKAPPQRHLLPKQSTAPAPAPDCSTLRLSHTCWLSPSFDHVSTTMC